MLNVYCNDTHFEDSWIENKMWHCDMISEARDESRICKFYNRSDCWRGERCPYRHVQMSAGQYLFIYLEFSKWLDVGGTVKPGLVTTSVKQLYHVTLLLLAHPPEVQLSFSDQNLSGIHLYVLNFSHLQHLLQNHYCIPSHQAYHNCSFRGPEEVLHLFQAIRNPRLLSWPPFHKRS